MTTPHNHTPASRTAAQQKTNAHTDRKKVLTYARKVGVAGSTNEEAAIALNMNGNTLRPRRWDLVDKGKIVITSQFRLTKHKRNAHVWVHHKFATKADRDYTAQYLKDKRARSKNRAQSVALLREFITKVGEKHGSRKVRCDAVSKKLIEVMDRLGLQ